MTKISRKKLDYQIEKEVVSEFWQAICEIQRIDEVQSFLKQLFTPTEILMLAKRLEILKQLRKNISYLSIKDTLKVTDSTVAKMNNLLHTADDLFRKILDNLTKSEERRWQKTLDDKRRAHQLPKASRLVFPRWG